VVNVGENKEKAPSPAVSFWTFMLLCLLYIASFYITKLLPSKGLLLFL